MSSSPAGVAAVIGLLAAACQPTPEVIEENLRNTPDSWLALADEFWEASTDTSDGGVGIPAIWGTDAVHGHSNIVGATLFPHNIGLGAANDPDLMYEIGRVTALEILTTGLDWTFAPAIAAGAQTVMASYNSFHGHKLHGMKAMLTDVLVDRMGFDGFVAAWLPGSEGGGIADVLFTGADGQVRHDFTGRLSFSWPATAEQVEVNVGDSDYHPLFPYGYGLSYGDSHSVAKLADGSMKLQVSSMKLTVVSGETNCEL